MKTINAALAGLIFLISVFTFSALAVVSSPGPAMAETCNCVPQPNPIGVSLADRWMPVQRWVEMVIAGYEGDSQCALRFSNCVQCSAKSQTFTCTCETTCTAYGLLSACPSSYLTLETIKCVDYVAYWEAKNTCQGSRVYYQSDKCVACKPDYILYQGECLTKEEYRERIGKGRPKLPW